MRATILDGVDRAFDIEERDLDIIKPDEFAAAWRQVGEKAGFEPGLGFHSA